ncbi:MAG: histidinol-phosphate aminotransferase [Solirubrobacteraceae bacterium]|nr:histidinol-phosphate aminotransferase [Solirubrobacteraceae bacterium]
MSPRRRLLGYYRQFEALSPEEDSRRLRARREQEKSAELARVGVLDLSRPDWHEPPDPEIVNAATFALRRSLNRYPDVAGSAALAAVAERHGVPAARVALGHGAGQLLQAALRELATGGEAVLPWPSWSPLPALISRAGVRPVPVPLGPGGVVDFGSLERAVGDATRAIVLCSPNDPTGVPVDGEALRSFTASLRPSVSVLVDEALVEFAGPDVSCAPLVEELPNLLVLRSFSKGWAMAGLRGGYVLGPAGDEELLAVLSPGQGVASPTLAAIAAALEDPARAARRLGMRRALIAAERERLARALEGTPFSSGPSSSHAVWLRGGEGMSAASITNGLAAQRVLVASGAEWGDDDHVRITLRDRPATERLAAALRAF